MREYLKIGNRCFRAYLKDKKMSIKIDGQKFENKTKIGFTDGFDGLVYTMTIRIRANIMFIY